MKCIDFHVDCNKLHYNNANWKPRSLSLCDPLILLWLQPLCRLSGRSMYVEMTVLMHTALHFKCIVIEWKLIRSHLSSVWLVSYGFFPHAWHVMAIFKDNVLHASHTLNYKKKQSIAFNLVKLSALIEFDDELRVFFTLNLTVVIAINFHLFNINWIGWINCVCDVH